LIHRGGCHCGTIRIAYRSELPAAAHTLRECQCSFCRKHRSLAVSDPDGSAEIAIAEEAKVSRYRFGLGTADFLICRDCGVYVAAVMSEGDKAWSVIVVSALDDAADFTGPVAAVVFDGEGTGDRVARRRAKWTPTTLANRS
jgi:hypothetical protein